MSEANGKSDHMKRLNDDAKLRGLMAVLALPPVRATDGTVSRIIVQVEIDSGLWIDIDSMYIEPETITVCRSGRACCTFDRRKGVPNWRTPNLCAADRVVIG